MVPPWLSLQQEVVVPGIFGVLARQGPPGAERMRSIANAMAASLQATSWLRTELWSDDAFCGGRVHLGILNRKAQPLAEPNAEKRVWFDGVAGHSSSASANTPSAARVLGWLEAGGSGLREVDGIFALSCYDPEKRELTLASDRLGLRPLYYSSTKGWFAYASEVKALLTIPDGTPRLDRIGLRQFFAFDYMLGERTWWESIKLLPPATLCRISSRDTNQTCYWSFSEIETQPVGEETALRRFEALWPRAIARRLRPGTMPLLLSGGLDSRLVLAEVRRQRADVSTVTFGERGSPDIRIARRCARLAGVPHRTLYLDASNWWLGREEAIWQTDGLVNARHLHVARAVQAMHAGNCYTLKHLAGNSLFGGSALRECEIAGWPGNVRQLLERRFRDNPFFGREEAVQVSVADCERYMCGPSPTCFVLSQGHRRWTLNGATALRSHCEVGLPGIGLEFLRLMLGGLTHEQIMYGRFYRRFLVDRYPRFFRNLPWQRTGRGLDESIPVRVARGLRARVRRRSRRPSALHAFVDYGPMLGESNVARRLATGELLVEDYLAGVRRWLEDPVRTGLDTRVLFGILTLESYLRRVVGAPRVL